MHVSDFRMCRHADVGGDVYTEVYIYREENARRSGAAGGRFLFLASVVCCCFVFPFLRMPLGCLDPGPAT